MHKISQGNNETFYLMFFYHQIAEKKHTFDDQLEKNPIL